MHTDYDFRGKFNENGELETHQHTNEAGDRLDGIAWRCASTEAEWCYYCAKYNACVACENFVHSRTPDTWARMWRRQE